MSVTVDVINIGTLSRNVLWEESGPVRPAHATTTLIRDDGFCVLVDPSLPPELMAHRLDERTGLKPDKIDAVFLTSFSPSHRRGLALFDKSDWFISERERETVQDAIDRVLEGGGGVEDVSLGEIQKEADMLGRLQVAPERFTDTVSLFPSYGASPGNASLLVSAARTIVIAGDAVVTRDYFDQRRVWDRSTDPAQAKESFAELIEIADAIVPGHDNIIYLG